jgi:hypothetical protein
MVLGGIFGKILSFRRNMEISSGKISSKYQQIILVMEAK